MAYKQPHVPPIHDGAPPAAALKEITRFLKDFTMETWVQVRAQEEEIRRLKEELRAMQRQ